MTENKSLKRRVRARMAKTGERYTAARRQVMERPTPRPAALPTPGDDALVIARTGRSWAEWFADLMTWGAADRPHGQIARHLSEDLGVDGWWSQSITVEFERAIGRRQVGQRADGTFVASASKTVGVPVEVLFDAFADEAMRARWLDDAPLTIRRASRPRSIRFDWADGSTRVVGGFEAKGESRSLVGVEHQRLADAAAVDARKEYWRARLEQLRTLLEG